MPTYTFKDTTTGEIFDVVMSISDLSLFVESHKQMERYYDSAPALVSGVSTSTRVDAGFKDVLSKIAEAHPGSALADEHRRKSIKQVQTERVIKRWKSNTDNT